MGFVALSREEAERAIQCARRARENDCAAAISRAHERIPSSEWALLQSFVLNDMANGAWRSILPLSCEDSEGSLHVSQPRHQALSLVLPRLFEASAIELASNQRCNRLKDTINARMPAFRAQLMMKDNDKKHWPTMTSCMIMFELREQPKKE